MSIYEYKESQQISQGDPSFYALIMSAMRKADTKNNELLKRAWPELHAEMRARYNAPAGALSEEELAWVHDQRRKENES